MRYAYIVDFLYFGLQISQRAYLMLTETDYSHCKKAASLYAQLTRQCIVHRQ